MIVDSENAVNQRDQCHSRKHTQRGAKFLVLLFYSPSDLHALLHILALMGRTPLLRRHIIIEDDNNVGRTQQQISRSAIATNNAAQHCFHFYYADWLLSRRQHHTRHSRNHDPSPSSRARRRSSTHCQYLSHPVRLLRSPSLDKDQCSSSRSVRRRHPRRSQHGWMSFSRLSALRYMRLLQHELCPSGFLSAGTSDLSQAQILAGSFFSFTNRSDLFVSHSRRSGSTSPLQLPFGWPSF